MIAEFKHTLRRLRGQIIGWSIGIGLYGLMMVSLFDTILEIEGFEEIIKQYPKELMGFFGDMMELTTPRGYMDTYFFSYMSIIIGIFIIGTAAKLLVGDEEAGILDLVLAYPVSRTKLFWGRVLAFILAVLIILGVGWISWAIPSGNTTMDLTWLEFLLPFFPLFAILFLFGTLTLLFTMFLPAGRTAGMLAGALLVGNFLMDGLANMNDNLKEIVKYLPLHYYEGGQAIEGVDWNKFLGLTGVALLFLLVSWYLFEKREIRVGGERSWKIPGLQQFPKYKNNRK